ncbi:DNA polymerase IV [Bacillus sp. UFRGS-B20]|nr:DNA polymerase IV [Bacillus sp. UFRGS-B20]
MEENEYRNKLFLCNYKPKNIFNKIMKDNLDDIDQRMYTNFWTNMTFTK